VVGRFLAAVLAAFAARGCVDAPAWGHREALILSTLAEDNLRWAARDPELLRAKYARMLVDDVGWMRGTTALFWRDLTTTGTWAWPTAFGSGPSARVLLLGDPHPENLGTYVAADGTATLDWNDFDATGYGPYWGDVRRWAVACAVAVGADEDRATALARIAGRAYADAMGQPLRGPTTLGEHALVDEELRDAQVDARDGLTLDALAPVGADGRRALRRGPLDPDDPTDALAELPDAERAVAVRAWADRALADLGWSAPARTVRDAARRYGSGVASFPALRYLVLVEGPTASPADDALVELKEVGEGVRVVDAPALDAAGWGSSAERAVATQRQLMARADLDPAASWVSAGATSFRSRTRDGSQRNLDAEALRDLEAEDPAAVDAFVQLGSEMLARAHGGAATADGVLGQAVIAPLLGGREAGFADEVAAFAGAYLGRLRADRRLMASVDIVAETVR
jgi:uncharacterized protein (DUF2252 family)